MNETMSSSKACKLPSGCVTDYKCWHSHINEFVHLNDSPLQNVVLNKLT